MRRIVLEEEAGLWAGRRGIAQETPVRRLLLAAAVLILVAWPVGAKHMPHFGPSDEVDATVIALTRGTALPQLSREYQRQLGLYLMRYDAAVRTGMEVSYLESQFAWQEQAIQEWRAQHK